jgi:hypothetical protein
MYMYQLYSGEKLMDLLDNASRETDLYLCAEFTKSIMLLADSRNQRGSISETDLYSNQCDLTDKSAYIRSAQCPINTSKCNPHGVFSMTILLKEYI